MSDINFSQETGPSAMSERLRGKSILVNVPEDNEMFGYVRNESLNFSKNILWDYKPLLHW